MANREPIPPIHTRLARVSTWLLLIGFIFFPTGQILAPNPRDSDASAVVDMTGDAGDADAAGDSTRLVYRAPQSHNGGGYIFAIIVLPALCSVLGSTGLAYVAFRRRADHAWLVDMILVPAMMASLAGLALVFYVVYKDGWTAWPVMEIVAATLAGMTSILLFGATLFVRRKARREAERAAAEEGGERGSGAPQIPEVERVTSLKDEVLPNGSSSR